MAKQLTIRGVSDEVGQSVNAIVLEILEGAVGVNERRRRLARYTTWTPEDLKEFNETLAAQRTIDDRRGRLDCTALRPLNPAE